MSELDPAARAAIQEKLLAAEQERMELEGHGIFVQLPNTAGYKGHRFMGVGSRLMFAGTESSTSHELFLHHLKDVLGDDWWREQDALAKDDRHFIRRCYDNWGKALYDQKQEGPDLWSAVPSGEAQSLLSLAFDVYLLAHQNSLPADWVDRLRNPNEYQGVRYELAVASIFARIACTLEFYDDKTEKEKHPEFVAVHKESGNKVVVEAKSRHREGVLHEKGSPDLNKAMLGDARRLFNRALKKETTGLPYLIFIDVNTPRNINEKTEQSRWYADIQNMMKAYHEPSEKDPDPYNMLAVTNYSHHYEGAKIVQPGQHCSIQPLFSVAPLADGVDGPFAQRIRVALAGYGFVPRL